MKQLLYKEARLSLHVTNYLFLALVLMLFIPSYPYYVTFFYTNLGLFFVFAQGREDNDVYFTALLPVAKLDVVKARCIIVMLVQLSALVLAVPVGILRNLWLAENAVGIEVNVAFFGLVLITMAAFNILFLPGFYKTAYKLGVPFLVASGAQFLLVAGFEALTYLPGAGAYLDTVAPVEQLAQLPVLLLGLAVYGGALAISYRVGAARFEKLDL